MRVCACVRAEGAVEAGSVAVSSANPSVTPIMPRRRFVFLALMCEFEGFDGL